jgi:hypothetical protein
LANAAFEAGEFATARDYGEGMLARAPRASNPWSAGSAIHQGHLILGRVALAQGDVEQAKSRLIDAVTAPGLEPILFFCSDGPNTALAKDLLEHGEKECVLDYFRRCSTYWKEGRARLARWMATIEQGKVPKLGSSLRY